MSQYAVKLRRERARLADETEVGGQISSGGTICQETTPSQWENPVHQRRRPAPWNEDNQSKHTKSGDTRVTVVRGYTRFADSNCSLIGDVLDDAAAWHCRIGAALPVAISALAQRRGDAGAAAGG